MKIFTVVLLAAHAAIHFMGTARAFRWAELAQLSQPISRGWGLVWGACALLLVGAALVRLLDASWWWMLGALAVLTSQLLIVIFWKDAKLGTIVNVLLLLAILIGFGNWRFGNRVERQLARLASQVPGEPPTLVESGDLAALPPVAAAWLRRAGIVGRARSHTVYLTQRGEMQTSPGGDWLSFEAEQWFLVPNPAFLWLVDVDAFFGLGMAGVDSYLDGKGSMRIELLSLIPVVNASGPTIDQGTLVRFLAEIMWFPSAALDPHIHWEAIDAHSARATIRHAGREVSGVFRFDDSGDVIGFEARRYRDGQLQTWIIKNEPSSFDSLDEVRIPTRSTVTWRDDDGESWTWLRLEVMSQEREAAPSRRGPLAQGM